MADITDRRALIKLTVLKRTANNAWIFRIDLDNRHATALESLMRELAKFQLFRGGWFVGNWWFEDAGMRVLAPLFTNWEEMVAQADAIEGAPETKHLTIP